jgi:tetratricopeptide (TPR) repeat protein
MGAMAPEEAAALLQRRPRAIRGILIAALDHWLILARHAEAREVGWLERVLAMTDSDAWRQRLRDAQGVGDRRALEELARDVDAAAQPPETLFLLDRALHQRGVREGAVALMRRAQDAFPGDFWINHNLGVALRDCEPPQAEEAIRFLTVATALRPDSPGVRLNLGLVLWDKGRLDEALEAFRRAITLKPDYADAHCCLGVVLLEKGRLDEALAAFRRTIDLSPDHADACYNLGNVLFRKGDLDGAIVAFRRAIDLRPDVAETYSDLGLALCLKGQVDEALAVARRAIDRDPNLGKAHFNVGYILKVKGRFDEAIAAYRRAIELDPDRAETHCNLGTALDSRGRLDEALAAFRKAISLKPDLAEAHFNLGLVLAREGRLDGAVAALQKTAVLKPDHAPAQYNLGNALRDQGRLGEAIAAYCRAIELKPDYAEAHCNLGGALRHQANFAESVAALKQGHELGSRRPDWPYPSARWVREGQRLLELDGRERPVVRGEVQPADAAERNEYAQLCYYKKLYVASARLRADAFAADPNLADSLEADHRYAAACAAALAGSGQGVDASGLGPEERMRLRKQALEWLRADLAATAKLLDGRTPEDRRLARQRLRQWRRDPELASLRDPASVTRLSPDEQGASQRLWADVDGLLAIAGTADAVRRTRP